MFKFRRLTYRWRLFVPMFAWIWLLVTGLALWQTNREASFRRSYVDGQLELISQRFVDAIETGNIDISENFLDFIRRYYDSNPILDDIRITIYDKNWTPIMSLRETIVLGMEDKKASLNSVIERDTHWPNMPGKEYFFRGASTADGQHHVIAAVPLKAGLRDFLSGDRLHVWTAVFAFAVVMSILLFLSWRHFSSNVSLLRQFAKRSATDPTFTPGTDFPHDELGDIARQIVTIFNERAKVRQRLDREHQVAMKAIEEKAAQKRQLTNNINHELKTPIGIIKGYLDTLADSPDLDPEMRDHFIRKARDHANRLSDLIAGVSAITRLSEGSTMITTEVINYHDLVYNFANDVNESGTLGHMEFVYDIPIDILVRGNSNLLTGMLMNLAKNSANYSCGATCSLEYNGETGDGQFYSFSFYDDGVGVPTESLPHLFERFYRIDAGRARKNGGTGLGLSIVYNTITALGGTIEALNRPDAGLEFRFTLSKASAARRRS